MSGIGAGGTEGLVCMSVEAPPRAHPDIARIHTVVVHHALLFLASDSAARYVREGREKVVKA